MFAQYQWRNEITVSYINSLLSEVMVKALESRIPVETLKLSSESVTNMVIGMGITELDEALYAVAYIRAIASSKVATRYLIAKPKLEDEAHSLIGSIREQQQKLVDSGKEEEGKQAARDALVELYNLVDTARAEAERASETGTNAISDMLSLLSTDMKQPRLYKLFRMRLGLPLSKFSKVEETINAYFAEEKHIKQVKILAIGRR
jgi:hypothetical protein